MGLLDRLLGRKSEPEWQPEWGQAVLVDIPGSGLPDAVYEELDIAGLEDALIEAIERSEAGELDGNEFGPDGVTLFMYGPDAERLFASVEPVLRAHPLCAQATVRIQTQGPTGPERVIRLGA